MLALEIVGFKKFFIEVKDIFLKINPAMKSTDEPIILEYELNSSKDKVWDALTQLDEMKLWYFENIESFIPEVGFETVFKVQVENCSFSHLWKITEVIPNQKISYDWKYLEYPGDSNMTFETIEKKEIINLKLTMTIIESFPDNIPEFKRESGIAGWNYIIGNNLKAYLESN
jgi:uncharacterized protein YndB with AHSA1/START domain